MPNHVYYNDLPDDFSIQGDLAIDTEAMGLNVKRDRLCVLQMSNGDGNCFLVHFDGKSYKAPNLVRLLKDNSYTKIFHFARFDLAIIRYYLDVMVEPIYCTKIASYIARSYSRFHGLKALCDELLNIKLNKQQQCSNWGCEKLTNGQIMYAASDVLYLHSIRDTLNVILKKENRYQLAVKCFKCLDAITEMDINGWNGSGIFEHNYYN